MNRTTPAKARFAEPDAEQTCCRCGWKGPDETFAADELCHTCIDAPLRQVSADLSEGSATLPGMTNTTHTDLPIPTGATTVDDWEDGGRLFNGSTMKTIEASGTLRDDVCVYTGGLQRDDGTFQWEVVAGNVHTDHPLTAAQARQIGEALIAAADELDAITEAVAR